MRIIDLTQPLSAETLSYPGERTAYRAETTPIEGAGGVVTRLLSLEMHSGTHLDAPLHFAENAPDVAALPLRLLPTRVVSSRGRRIEASDVPEDCCGRAVLFHTGWSRYAGTPRYFSDYPFLTATAAQRLVDRSVALVGLDTPSVDDRTNSAEYPAHQILCGADVPIVEGLIHLEAIPTSGRPAYFAASPIPLAGIEASPVRAVVLVDEAAPS